MNFTEDDEVAVMKQKPSGKPETWFLCTFVAALMLLLLQPNLPPGPIPYPARAGKKAIRFLLQAVTGNGCVRKLNVPAFINSPNEQLPHKTHSTAVAS